MATPDQALFYDFGSTLYDDPVFAADFQTGHNFGYVLGLGTVLGGVKAGPSTAARGSTTLYRAVSTAEHADIAATGVLRAGPNSIEAGKWFAESAAHARQWGNALEGAGNFRVIEATFPRATADQFLRNPFLDNIGPARFGTFEQMGNPTITLLPGP